MANIYSDVITDAELLDFSQNLSVDRNYTGNRLFPDRKVQYLKAEWARIIKNGSLPTAAYVHALDTEAHIASRVPWEQVSTEKLLIKQKINVTENLAQATNGMKMDGIKEFVFDDIARMAEGVPTRAELMKMEAITTGKVTVSENGVNVVIDYGVPAENKDTASWSTQSDILSDIMDWFTLLEDGGAAPDRIITSRAIYNVMARNESFQTAILGSTGVGTILTLDQINSLLSSMFDGLRIETNEQRYGIEAVGADGSAVRNNGRMFPANKFVMLSTGANGSIGTGLWGVTPEEEAQGQPFNSLRQQQFVTVTQWDTPDPVAHWTKASGMFVPVIADPNGVGIIDVTISEG